MDAGNPLENQKCNFHKDNCNNYGNFFRNRRQGELTLDSTTHYFFQNTALEQLSIGNTKICVVLREPASRLISYFQYVCETRDAVKRKIDFGEFVTGLIESDVDKFKECFYEEREFFALQTALQQGKYADYLKRWKTRITPANFMIVLFEDLVSNQKQVLSRICDFFDIDAGNSDFCLAKDNETYRAKYPRINRVARWASRLIDSERIKRPIRRFYLQFQKSKVPDIYSQYPGQIELLKRYYVPFIKEFNEVSSIDTTEIWRQKNEFITS